MSDESVSPIVQYWHSEEVPEAFARAIETFGERNPEMSHLVFHEESAASFIAEHFTPREVAAFRSCAVPAMQADYFRYCAVLALGGFYSDAGLCCIAGLRPLIPAAGRGSLFQAPAGNIVNGIFAFGSPGHALLELSLEIATANIERRLSDRVYFTTGVPIFICLVNLPRFGSFDAMIARFADSRLGEFVRAYCEAIGDYARVERAVETIEVSAAGSYRAFIRPAVTPAERTGPHWSEVGDGIFRP